MTDIAPQYGLASKRTLGEQKRWLDGQLQRRLFIDGAWAEWENIPGQLAARSVQPIERVNLDEVLGERDPVQREDPPA
jgi:hypothetical protein